MKTGQILQILFALLFGFVASLVLGGFILGFMNCSDCSGIVGRVFLGAIWSVLAVLSLGRIPTEMGMYSVWPMVLVPWALISGPLVWLLLRRHARAA